MSNLNVFKHGSWLMASLLVLSLAFAMSTAQAHDIPYDGHPAFEFTDDFYRANGINPDGIGKPDFLNGDFLNGGPGGPPRPVGVETGVSPHPDYSSLRIDNTLGGFAHNGNKLYFTSGGGITDDDFTNDDAGIEARRIANKYHAFVFLMDDGNLRQDVIFDERDGYYGANPLGLWLLKFVSWNDTADPVCEDAMADMGERDKNGFGDDFLPLFRTVPEIERMEKKGCVTVSENPTSWKWVICPVFKDPRQGALADAELVSTLNKPAFEDIVGHFECLRDDGDFCPTDSGVIK